MYVTEATLKGALKVTDNDRQALISHALKASAKAIHKRANIRKPYFGKDDSATPRVFPTVGRTVPERFGELLLVDDISATTDLVVEVSDDGSTWTVVDAGGYEVKDDNALTKDEPITGLLRTYARWSTSRLVRVTARWGWPAVPEDIPQAQLMQATRLYKRKDSPEGVAGSAEWGLIRVPHLDPDVRAIVDQYRRQSF